MRSEEIKATFDEQAALIAAAGFEPPVQFYQAGLIHAWFSKRSPEIDAKRN
ncbi:MAG: hypothetical protein ACE37I_04675 [Rubinisphaera brasiliensis]|uniref:hypothetical protein n=1 Tax=Rubinisphaera brasiliensis TaxID=119 RepID=UPI00391DB40D